MEPPQKKAKTTPGCEPGSSRFSTPRSPSSMTKICEGFIPKNTAKATTWALRVFFAWRNERNRSVDEQCPENLLEEPVVESLNYWLSRFVVEARRDDGKPYPATSLKNILAGLYRHAKSCAPKGKSVPDFMSRKDPSFRDLTGAIQVQFRELRERGVGAVVKHAPVITYEEEEALWQSKVIGDHCPLALLRAVFYYVGKAFCIRGGEEQRNLKRSQFVRSSDGQCYTYIENGSKNRSGINSKEANKIVPVYSCIESRPRCLVYLLDLYFDKFPPQAVVKDLFYLRPNKSASSVWYDCASIGRDKLAKFLEQMCLEAGISEKKTNHCLRATGTSALFNAGVPEKLIRDVTGHRSNALQLYERPTLQQKQNVSNILVQGTKEYHPGKENAPVSAPVSAPTQLHPPATVADCASNVFGSLFSHVNNCNITISPQCFSVNVSNPQPPQQTDFDVKTLDGIEPHDLF